MNKSQLPYHQKPGFKVPDNYFEDFESKILREVGIEKSLLEIDKIAPGFSVPNNYFETLENEILQKVESTEKKGKIISLFNTSRYYYAAAVAAVFIGIVSTLFFSPVTQDYNLDSLEFAAIENYIEEGYIDLNYNQLSSFITEEGYTYDNFYTSGLSDDEVFDYINETIEDHELLFE